jgi:endogenous inhibitor of DNA gyrase (YacG/DUF329 family)
MNMQDKKMHRVVACPTCGAPVPWLAESIHRPFCSERCRIVDLGAWASESYRVADCVLPESDPEDTSLS